MIAFRIVIHQRGHLWDSVGVSHVSRVRPHFFLPPFPVEPHVVGVWVRFVLRPTTCARCISTRSCGRTMATRHVSAHRPSPWSRSLLAGRRSRQKQLEHSKRRQLLRSRLRRLRPPRARQCQSQPGQPSRAAPPLLVEARSQPGQPSLAAPPLMAEAKARMRTLGRVGRTLRCQSQPGQPSPAAGSPPRHRRKCRQQRHLRLQGGAR